MNIKFTRCQQAQSLAQTKEASSLNHCQSNLSIFLDMQLGFKVANASLLYNIM